MYKKIILAFAIGSMAISVAIASPASSAFFYSGELSYNRIQDSSISSGSNAASFKTSSGLGVGAYIGYDYALNSNITIGAKTGYNYTFGLAQFKLTNAQNVTLDSSNIPLLLNSKYFFDSGYFVGVEGGVNWQVLHENIGRSSSDGDWNAEPILGILGGYKWDTGFSVSGAVDYIFGKNIDIASASPQTISKDDALSNIKVGIQVSYSLPPWL